MNPIFIILIVILLVAFIFSSLCKTPKGKGIIGELKVKKALGKTKNGDKYVFNNFMIVDEGKSSQIDHIVVNKSGVYVIETKNYSGIISGHKDQQQWTQTLSYGKVKNEFYNPLKQNATHIYRLKKLIGVEVPIYSVVVFVQNNAKYVDAKEVISSKELKKMIKTGPKLLSSDAIDELAKKIIQVKNSEITMREHINEIQEMQNKVKDGYCPRCGGKLVLKNGQYGQFYGCSNYPNCKFTKKNIDFWQ